MVSTDTVFDEQATFRLPGILRNLTYGDFVYDKTLGLMAYHEFGFLTCNRWVLDHLYPLDGFEVRSSLALADPTVVLSFNATAVTQCKTSVTDYRKLYCVVQNQNPINDPIYDYSIICTVEKLLRESRAMSLPLLRIESSPPLHSPLLCTERTESHPLSFPSSSFPLTNKLLPTCVGKIHLLPIPWSQHSQGSGRAAIKILRI